MNPIALFRSGPPLPSEHKANFTHLYLDMAWFAVVFASSLSFVGVYAARLGGSALQLGLLSVGPLLATLIFALPAGRWLEKKPVDAAVFWQAILHRLFYALWPLLPLFFGATEQIWALIALTLVMNIPGTALSVGFNALFAEVVPPDWRGHVAGTRNALLSAVSIVTSLICGQILNRVPFPVGYQIVFGLGFLGAVMSTVHLWFIFPPSGPRRRRLADLAWLRRGAAAGPRRPLLRTEILKGPFGRLLAVIALFHVSWYLPIPIFPLHYVNNLHLTDGEIGLGSALFSFSALVMATQLARLSRRLGHRRITAVGGMILSLFPALLAAARGLSFYLVASAVGGLGWSLMSASVINLILEKVPADDRTAYLGWYSLAINGAAMVGVLAGPLAGSYFGLVPVLAVDAGLRLAAALAIWRWA